LYVKLAYCQGQDKTVSNRKDRRLQSTSTIMRLFDMPLELVEKIVYFSIRVRTFKRALRLRLINSKPFYWVKAFEY
jgi:hypothetical protein